MLVLANEFGNSFLIFGSNSPKLSYVLGGNGKAANSQSYSVNFSLGFKPKLGFALAP